VLTSASKPFSQAFSITLQDHGYRLVYHALLSQLSLGTHPSLTTKGEFRLRRPGSLVLRRGG